MKILWMDIKHALLDLHIYHALNILNQSTEGV